MVYLVQLVKDLGLHSLEFTLVRRLLLLKVEVKVFWGRYLRPQVIFQEYELNEVFFNVHQVDNFPKSRPEFI